MQEIHPEALHDEQRRLDARLHRVVVHPWPLEEPVALKRDTFPACSSGLCQGGRRPCPCPQACQLPDNGLQAEMLRHLCDFLDMVPPRHFWLAYATFLLACFAGVHLIAGG